MTKYTYPNFPPNNPILSLYDLFIKKIQYMNNIVEEKKISINGKM